jgi:hypothetical protein
MRKIGTLLIQHILFSGPIPSLLVFMNPGRYAAEDEAIKSRIIKMAQVTYQEVLQVVEYTDEDGHLVRRIP